VEKQYTKAFEAVKSWNWCWWKVWALPDKCHNKNSSLLRNCLRISVVYSK